MTITVYRSDDASAPTLTGQIGSLTTLLDAILVNGYGAKSAAGWAIDYTATNRRCYRATTGNGNRRYLAVDDNNTLAGGAQYARTVAYETMSAIATGTGPVPTAAQVSGGLWVQKSITADATTRPWFAIASDRFFYFVALCQTAAASTPVAANYGDCWLLFGDFPSKVPSGDVYNTLHFCNGVTANNNSLMALYLSTTFTAQVGHYVMRPYTLIGSSAGVAKAVARRSASSAPTSFGNDTYAPNFPDPITGGMDLAEALIVESGGGSLSLTRGLIPGLYDIAHNPTSLAAAYNNLDTIAGAGAFAGITFTLVKLPNGPSNQISNYAAIQSSGTWPT